MWNRTVATRNVGQRRPPLDGLRPRPCRMYAHYIPIFKSFTASLYTIQQGRSKQQAGVVSSLLWTSSLQTKTSPCQISRPSPPPVLRPALVGAGTRRWTWTKTRRSSQHSRQCTGRRTSRLRRARRVAAPPRRRCVSILRVTRCEGKALTSRAACLVLEYQVLAVRQGLQEHCARELPRGEEWPRPVRRVHGGGAPFVRSRTVVHAYVTMSGWAPVDQALDRGREEAEACRVEGEDGCEARGESKRGREGAPRQ